DPGHSHISTSVHIMPFGKPYNASGSFYEWTIWMSGCYSVMRKDVPPRSPWRSARRRPLPPLQMDTNSSAGKLHSFDPRCPHGAGAPGMWNN
ncbi:MAG: hypothetical protein ACP5O1_08760, partial [Phycisphaerae bacterium]